MRILYLLFKILFQFPVRLFYPKIKLVNAPKTFFGRTVYVCNHASSFMDPLVISVLQNPIVFFMTRSDVFKKALKPLLWSVQMLPIYREQDGHDTKERNEEVFAKCNKILKQGRNLLIFGEGFTDNIFIRRLKPVKKGAVRIGFGALEDCNWDRKIYMCAVGINYADPNYFGSELLISNSNKVCLNDYKENYLENPIKTVNELTKLIEKLLQEQLTHIENIDWVFFHEQVCRLKRNGLHPDDSDSKIPMKTRWENSRKLALWLNEQDLEKNSHLLELKQEIQAYFEEHKKLKVEEKFIYEQVKTGKLSTNWELLNLIAGLIFVPLGIIHFYIPYRFVKRFAEKTFKRRVFWSSIKMMLGSLVLTIYNIPLVILLHYFVFHNGIISFAYLLILPLIGVISYAWFAKLKIYKQKKALQNMNFDDLIATRNKLIVKINALIPSNL